MKRLYSLFVRPRAAKPGTRWIRISHYAFPKQTAIKHFQSELIDGAFHPDHEYRLLPVKQVSHVDIA